MAKTRLKTDPGIDAKLRELAVLDFDKFCQIAGVDKVQAAICMERQKGRSLQAIAHKMNMPKSTVDARCKKCPA